ncbi:MAG TPA: hypothetical protein VN577_12605 [Terriglobales bacterium]|nr:hypothetical protein [Terriglobales bacterium]
MKSFSVGRFPRGSVFVLLFCLFGGLITAQDNNAQPAFSKRTPQQARPCDVPIYKQTKASPAVQFDCTRQLNYLGMYSPEGEFRAAPRHSRWYNEAAPTPIPSQLRRPAAVPPSVNLMPLERVVENYDARYRAAKIAKGESRLVAMRDAIIRFAYGRERALQAPQHVVTDSRGRVIISDHAAAAVHVLDGKMSFRIVGGPHHNTALPDGIAVDADDNIYVSDPVRGLVGVYDPNGRFLYHIGKVDDETLFEMPTGLAIDKAGKRIYVLDTPRNMIMVMDFRGAILNRIGRGKPVEFNQPTEIALRDGALAVMDSGGARIQLVDLEGNLISQFKTGLYNEPQTNRHFGIAIDGDQNVYMSNLKESTVKVFDSKGNAFSIFGRYGQQDGEFSSPSGVWIDTTSRIYVADTNNSRVQVFQLAGVGNHSAGTN